jgi:cytochrome subunit of sulfide dehydrogenase
MIRYGLLAAVLASGLPIAAQAQALDPYLGRNLAANCANCHGTNGHSVSGMPALAGRSRGELEAALRDFRGGRRPGTVMPQLAKGYTEAQIEAVSEFLSRQSTSAP